MELRTMIKELLSIQTPKEFEQMYYWREHGCSDYYIDVDTSLNFPTLGDDTYIMFNLWANRAIDYDSGDGYETPPEYFEVSRKIEIDDVQLIYKDESFELTDSEVEEIIDWIKENLETND